jgi:hypothetical protein
MTSDRWAEVCAKARRAVLDAVGRGDIPRGGPSELAARDLLDEVPDGYWERWSARAVDRIREQREAQR